MILPNDVKVLVSFVHPDFVDCDDETAIVDFIREKYDLDTRIKINVFGADYNENKEYVHTVTMWCRDAECVRALLKRASTW
jgi:hypothetical protein